MGRLYSQAIPSLRQALQYGLTSSHFVRRRRQVKQPVLDRRCSFDWDSLDSMALEGGVALGLAATTAGCVLDIGLDMVIAEIKM
jgi:hypothetical protein